ncbi:MAG: VanZ family protein [Coriobacteriia bacterium]|nr:VanZ family protein [Coriobacteriia bacterium]
MNKATRIILSFLASALLFCSLFIVMNGSMLASAHALAFSLGLGGSQVPYFIWAFTLFVSIVLFFNFYQLLGNRLSVLLLRADAIGYLVLLFVVVMLKTIGIQELNLNMFDLYTQIIEYPESVLFNILLFVPLGALAFRYIKSTLMALVLGLTLILAIETMQYLLHLGITDIVDVVVCMAGFAIGYFVVSLLWDRGFRFVSVGEKHRAIANVQQEAIMRDVSVDCKEEARKESNFSNKNLALFLLTIGLSVLFVIGFFLYEPEKYTPWEPELEMTSDITLRSLPTLSRTPSEVKELVNAMNLFMVEGEASSRNWVDVDEAGVLRSTGVINNYSSWLRDDSVVCHGLTLNINETVRGITVTHGIPIIVTPETELIVNGEKVDNEMLGYMLDELYFYQTDAAYTLQDEWFRAEKLTFSSRNLDESDYWASFDYVNFSLDSKDLVSAPDGFWFKISENKASQLMCRVDIVSEFTEADNYITVWVPDRLGGASICHVFNINVEGRDFQTTNNEDFLRVKIALDVGQLVLKT